MYIDFINQVKHKLVTIVFCFSSYVNLLTLVTRKVPTGTAKYMLY